MKNFIPILAIFVSVLTGCNQPSVKEQTETEMNDVQISEAQFVDEKMKLGAIDSLPFQQVVTCKGYVKAPGNSIALINSQLAGFVKSIDCAFADHVKKGQVLCTVSSLQLMEIQQNYVESLTHLNRLSADYNRAKRLAEEKIGSQKEFLAIESEYKVTQARCESLKLQLQMLNLNSRKIEQGNLYSRYPLLAPIDGYITRHELVLGEFIEQNEDMIEIVNNQALQLELLVYETDIDRLKVGQTAYFASSNSNGEKHKAKISRLGKAITTSSNSIQCIANIEGESSEQFYNGAFVQVEVLTENRMVGALPNEALFKIGPNFYVFQMDHKTDGSYFFNKKKVEVGTKSDRYTEILFPKDLSEVLTKGAYNLSAE